MDIYLTSGALKAIEASAVLSRPARPAGILIGHVRGGRFFVEGAASGTDEGWTTPETYERLDRLYPGRIIGFFVFSRSAVVRRKIGRPHACGKIVLALAAHKDAGLDIEGFFIDYAGRFVFEPLPVIREKETTP
jgi:hypothetical protein